jgi:hypothetical protein
MVLPTLPRLEILYPGRYKRSQTLIFTNGSKSDSVLLFIKLGVYGIS